jgi:hypothetical protein
MPTLRRAPVALLLTSLLAPASAFAQTRVDGGPWRPELSVDPNAVPWVEGTLVPGAGNWNVQSVLEYVRNPLVVNVGGERVALARDQLWLTAGAQVGIGTRMAFALQVPVLLYQASVTGGTGLAEADQAALGDPRFVLRWTTRREMGVAPIGSSANGGVTASQHSQSQREQREGAGFALNLAGTAPLGSSTSFASWGAPTLHLFGVFDFRLFRIVGALSLGYRLRVDDRWPAQSGTCVDPTSPACLFDVPQRDQITWGFAIRQPLEGLLALIFLGISPRLASASILAGNWVTTYATFQGAIDARAPFATAAGTPVEMGAGIQTSGLGEFTLSAGAAWGLTAAPGSAAVRAIVSLQWAPRFVDEDRDGLRDDPAIDQCIGLAEDFDGYEDTDGCPEDNDHDAIPDEEDRCPFVDEDEDGFEDEDGCPDADNDADGVPDADDRCPDEAQGAHADGERRGCPDHDLDHDGVPNADDQCPDASQGQQPDPARPGCAAPDADRDGVIDADDRCPAEPAGEGAAAAQRGCPETDRDHDGVVDASDRCAEQPETLNGVQDDDGCPEVSARPGVAIPGAVVRVRVDRSGPNDPGSVALLQPVRFGADDRVALASNPVLAQLAVALRATARPASRWWELSVPTTTAAVRGALAVDGARANRRRDNAIAALRALGVSERALRAGEPAAPLPPRVVATGGDRGVVLVLHDEAVGASPASVPAARP